VALAIFCKQFASKKPADQLRPPAGIDRHFNLIFFSEVQTSLTNKFLPICPQKTTPEESGVGAIETKTNDFPR